MAMLTAPIAAELHQAPPAPFIPALTAMSLSSQPSMAAGSASMPFSIPPSAIQPTSAVGAFGDSATMAADMLHSILVQAAKASGEDSSSYVAKAIQNPEIMQVCSGHTFRA